RGALAAAPRGCCGSAGGVVQARIMAASDSGPLRIVLLGDGSLGCAMGAYLARDGHQVTIVARRERLAELRGRPARVSGLVEFEAPVAWTAAGAVPDADVLIVTVKTFQTAEALDGLGDAHFDATLSFQNGVVKNEYLEARYPGRVLGATTQFGAEMAGLGHARYILDGRTYVGELDGSRSARAARIAAALDQAGIPTEERTDIRGVEWSKLCQYVGAAFMAGAASALLHQIYLSEDLAPLYLRATREVAAVAAAAGVEVVDCPGFAIASQARLPFAQALAMIHERGRGMQARGITQVRSSLLQALEAGRPTEAEDTAGWVVATAARLGVAVPTVETLYHLVRARAAASA